MRVKQKYPEDKGVIRVRYLLHEFVLLLSSDSLCFEKLAIIGHLEVSQDTGSLWCRVLNKPFPSSPGPLYQNEVKCSALHLPNP